MKKILLLIFLIVFIASCKCAKDAFTLKKKASGDEFLVEKKSPLVMPPDYGKLPMPSNDNPESEKKLDQNENIEISQKNEVLKKNKIIKNSNPSKLEKSILKKIK